MKGKPQPELDCVKGEVGMGMGMQCAADPAVAAAAGGEPRIAAAAA